MRQRELPAQVGHLICLARQVARAQVVQAQAVHLRCLVRQVQHAQDRQARRARLTCHRRPRLPHPLRLRLLRVVALDCSTHRGHAR